MVCNGAGVKMKKSRLIIIALLTLVMMCSLAGCYLGGSSNNTLTITKVAYDSTGGSNTTVYDYTPVVQGDEYFCIDSYSSLEVHSVTDDKVVLYLDGCMVEPNKDGTINLNADPIKKLTINKGQTVKLVSQTMDAGINVEISYYDLNIHQSNGD